MREERAVVAAAAASYLSGGGGRRGEGGATAAERDGSSASLVNASRVDVLVFAQSTFFFFLSPHRRMKALQALTGYSAALTQRAREMAGELRGGTGGTGGTEVGGAAAPGGAGRTDEWPVFVAVHLRLEHLQRKARKAGLTRKQTEQRTKKCVAQAIKAVQAAMKERNTSAVFLASDTPSLEALAAHSKAAGDAAGAGGRWGEGEIAARDMFDGVDLSVFSSLSLTWVAAREKGLPVRCAAEAVSWLVEQTGAKTMGEMRRESGEAVGEGEVDMGVLGILDKLQCENAAVFVSGCPVCGGEEFFDLEIGERRREMGRDERNNVHFCE